MKNVLVLALLVLIGFGYAQTMAQGTWVPLVNSPRYHSGGVMILLTDGTVICKTDTCFCDIRGTGAWSRLTPDIHGSYVKGTWDSIANMSKARVYFASQVLQDGRVFVGGGEEGNGQSSSEIYDPLKNKWTMLPTTGHVISDANSEILPNGNVLFALVDINGNVRATEIFYPKNDSMGPGPSCLRTHNESAWIKLRDSSILFMDGYSTTSERYIPTLNKWVNDAVSPVDLYDPLGKECGPAFILPDGRGFFLGSTSHNAYYTPSGNATPGTWTAGPDFPNSQGMPDAAGAMMVNGKILCVTSANPVFGDTVYPHPTSFYEFDYLTNSFTRISVPGGGDTIAGQCYKSNLLQLPDGNLLFSNQGSKQYYVYVPDGTPLAAGKPTIATTTLVGCDTFMITGTLFNGISEGSAYGDDWQMATNYPMVRLTSGNNVYYGRTYHWNRTGVQTGNLPDTTLFFLPASVPAGQYSLVVTANGIASDAVSFNYSPCPAGVEEIQNANGRNILVYPNPSDGMATVVFATRSGGNYMMHVHDMLGRTIMKETGEAVAGNNYHSLSSAGMAAGVYIISVQEGNDIVDAKWVVR